MQQFPKEFLVNKETNILEREGIYIHTPSQFARESLYYVRLAAFYTCGARYEVRRVGLAAFLLFYIKEGEMIFDYEGQRFTAGTGDVVLLDCLRPHHYRALKQTRFYWFHFDGCSSRAYFDYFLEGKGIHFEKVRRIEEYFVLVQAQMRGGVPDEGMLSVHVHRILAMLFSAAARGGSPSGGVARAKAYMEEHYMENISMEMIAAASGFSQSHLFRIFREETGLTPYAYLMNVRMNQAMKMLLNTSASVEEIADSCAYCSSANFIRAFRQSTGTTPHKFRKLISGVTSSL